MRIKANSEHRDLVEHVIYKGAGSMTELLKSGFYWINPNAVTDLPAQVWFGGLVIRFNDDTMQILFSISGASMYVRWVRKIDGTVQAGNWRRVEIPEIVGGVLKTCFALRNLVLWGYSHAEGEGKNAVRNRRSGWNRGDAFGGFKRDKNAWNLLLLKLRNRHLPERTSELLKFRSADTHCASGEINRDRAGYPVPNHSDKRHEWKLQTRLDRLARLAGLEGHVKGLIGGGARV